MQGPRLRRRTLLVSGLAAAFLPMPRQPLFAPLASSPRGETDLEAEIRVIFSDVDAARATGARYLRDHGTEADRDLLHRLLFGRRQPSPAALRRLFAERRALDFAREDTVIVAGWMLARSAPRLCALAAMVPPSS